MVFPRSSKPQDFKSAFIDIEFIHSLNKFHLKRDVSSNPHHYDEKLLARCASSACRKNSVSFIRLTPIQRKFVTHYRCSNCGLLPLYHIDVTHVRKPRCKKCCQTVPFKAKGKYGKLRKDVAFEILRSTSGLNNAT